MKGFMFCTKGFMCHLKVFMWRARFFMRRLKCLKWRIHNIVEGSGIKRKSHRLGREAHAVFMTPRQHDAAARLPEHGLDQTGSGSNVAKRLFHKASSYSMSARLSQTRPPPTLSTARPASTKSVRMATLNSARPSGAAQPMAPQ